jgi:glycerol-3-phosphate dehydrogenase
LSTANLSCDVLIVGGGVNGAGIARDLAGRGLSVVLVEQDDLASHTSSSSTKLIHGGLRYLEHREFALVRKALAEREVLLRIAPHIMWPMRFVMPHEPSMRPFWMIRAGLFLYDHLARRELLAGSETIDLRRHPAGLPMKPFLRRAFVYSDGWVDDARLVVLNAMDARDRGAQILTRCRCVQARREGGLWSAELRSTVDQGAWSVQARLLVNAAGPWAAEFLQQQAGVKGGRTLRLVKGSHIVIPRLFEHDDAYLLQAPDRRVIFVIPYEEHFTLVGTTDVEVPALATPVKIDANEIQYLCDQVNRYFERQILPAHVVWSYAGVRPLLEDEASDASSVTRDYQLELDTNGPVLLSVWGGKITTYRKLAEEAARLIAGQLGVERPDWTEAQALPGGDLSPWLTPSDRPDRDIDQFLAQLVAEFPALPPALLRRWVRAYGGLVRAFLTPDRPLGEELAPGVFEGELRYLRASEWALTLEDVLWRRSKLGLHLSPPQTQRLSQWWEAEDRRSGPAS